MNNITNLAPLDKGPLPMRQWQLREKPTSDHPQFWDVVHWWSKIGYYNPDYEPENALKTATIESERVIFSYAALIRSRPPHGIQRPSDALKYIQEKIENNTYKPEIDAWAEALKNDNPSIAYRLLFQNQHIDKQTQTLVIQDTDINFDDSIEYMFKNLVQPNNLIYHIWNLCGGTLRSTITNMINNHDIYKQEIPQIPILNMLE